MNQATRRYPKPKAHHVLKIVIDVIGLAVLLIATCALTVLIGSFMNVIY